MWNWHFIFQIGRFFMVVLLFSQQGCQGEILCADTNRRLCKERAECCSFQICFNGRCVLDNSRTPKSDGGDKDSLITFTDNRGSECPSGGSKSCYTGNPKHESVGLCKQGRQECIGGKWGSCINQVFPAKELCDNADNNCNGESDEFLSRPCRSRCGAGAQICKKGHWTLCDARMPKAEICDGVDNDCDGQVDESCKCKAKGVQSCGLGIGLCRKGTQTCQNSGEWGPCVGRKVSVPEICNRLDDNCDGRIDENLERTCKKSCGFGRQVCSQGSWSPCDASGNVCEPGKGESRLCGANERYQVRVCISACRWGSWGTCR